MERAVAWFSRLINGWKKKKTKVTERKDKEDQKLLIVYKK